VSFFDEVYRITKVLLCRACLDFGFGFGFGDEVEIPMKMKMKMGEGWMDGWSRSRKKSSITISTCPIPSPFFPSPQSHQASKQGSKPAV